MPTLRSNQGARRGVVLAVEGLVIWVLAATVASYTAREGVGQVSGFEAAFTLEIMRSWIQTPSMGSLALTGYVGLAIAVAGPSWYWVVSPLRASVLNRADQDQRAEEEFIFDHGERGAGSQSGQSDLEYRDEPIRTQSTDWIAALFGSGGSQPRVYLPTSIRDGDFLRSSGGPPDASDIEHPESDDGRDPIGQARYRSDEETNKDDTSAKSPTIAQLVMANGGSGPKKVELGSTGTETVDESASDTSEYGTEAVSADREAASAHTTPPSELTASTDADGDTATPHEAIASSIRSARSKLSDVSIAISRSADGSVPDEVTAAIGDLQDGGKHAFQPLRNERKTENHPVREGVLTVRAAQARIETAFADQKED